MHVLAKLDNSDQMIQGLTPTLLVVSSSVHPEKMFLKRYKCIHLFDLQHNLLNIITQQMNISMLSYLTLQLSMK